MTRHIPAVVASLGLVVVVGGTFLPWFRSGTVERHSYRAVALADQFGLLDGTFVGAALRVWIAVPLLSALCVALFVLGLARTAATLTALLASSVGTVALVVTVQGGDSGGLVGITSTGPVTTIVGTAIALTGALCAFIVTIARAGRYP